MIKKPPILLLFLLVISVHFLKFFFHKQNNLNLSEISCLIIIMFTVAAFEELLFRGLFLNELIKIINPIYGIIVSSFLFTLFHIEAQPLATFPLIFFYGVSFGFLRYMGVSLIYLIVLHFVENLFIYLLMPSISSIYNWIYLETIFMFIIMLFVIYFYKLNVVK